MKTTIIILTILVIIAILNTCVGSFIHTGIHELLPHINDAKSALQAGNLEEATVHVRILKEKWDKKESIWEAFVNHEESEHVETLLTRVEAMLTAGTPELILPELEELEFFFEHMDDMQKFMPENIF